MADVASAAGRRGGAFPPGALAPIAAGLLVAAMLLAAGAALGGGPLRWAAVALIAVSAAAAAFVLHALLAQRAPATAAEPAFEALVRALGEPAAIVAEDGALAAANQSWRERVGPHRRLARASLGETPALLRAAARDGQASQGATIGDAPYRLEAARLDGARFLVRLSPISPLAAPLAKAATATPAAQPASLDPFAAASPFGAALIEGADPFVGAILEVNEAWAAIAGAPAAAGSSLGALLTDASRADAAQRLAAGGAGPFEVTPNARRASVSHLYVSRLDGHAVAYLVDVTDQKQMQAQLAQSSKMQAIGQLAGGVAHDFNNLLTAILMNLSELEMRHPLGDPSFDGLARIRENAIRAAGLVGQLLTFSRKVTVQRETLDVGELISNVTVMLRRLLPESVGMETDYGRNLPQIRADRQQLENAVMNLVVNARDAVRGKGGGTITVRAARLSEADARGLGYEGQPMGEMALLEVADDGPGIPLEVMPKIFDPFFTTKAVGEGTGLGLATVYGIVKQMDGWIAPISRPGEGATFRIFLPVYEPPVLIEPPAPAPPKGRAAARDLSGVGRILFVEDEDAVRKVAARLLKARGYEVIEAADGEEALAIAEQNAGRIDLMISDVIMPGLDGPHLLKAARPYLADAPVMFISGYAEAEFSKVLEGEPGVSFLAKPIDITVLAERVKQALQRA